MADDFSNTPFWGNDEQSNAPNQPSSTPWGTVWGKKKNGGWEIRYWLDKV